MVKIAIAAASSQVGREILDKLVATGNHNIIALIRKDPSSMPIFHGVQWVQTTYEDTSQLARTLAGIHTVLCFVDPVRDPFGDVQKRLIDASIQAGVKRFAPSEWSIGRKLEDCLDAIPWHITLFPMLFDFDNLRTIVVEEDLHARITFTTIQDIAGVVARAIEYDGEWPVYGGMGGGTATVAEILALGERIRGRPFNIRWVKKADVEAGTADLTPMWEEVHPTIAALPKEQREETAKVIPKGLLTMVGISAWETTTGMISSWFVADLVLSRSDAKVRHVIQSIGSSNIEKGKTFASQFCPQSSPTVYGSYEDVYKDPNVDIIYIGTPHAFHKQNCLDAIAMGKPILCEKAFTLNARDAKEVFLAAKKKGVYITEAMWLRHRPLVQDLQKRIHVDKMIGDIIRVYSDFGLEKDILSLPEDSRYRQPSLGAGSLLDLGIYPITWVLLCLDHECPPTPEPFIIQATQTHLHDVEVSTAALLQRQSTGQHGVVSSTTLTTGSPDMVARIQGTEGVIEVHGECPSAPLSFTVYSKFTRDMENETISRQLIDTFKYPVMGRGYYFEADNAALDVLEGRLESPIMPWSESVRVLEIMDEIRRQGGTVYAGDSK
ncbi:hypothetical protein NM208_g7624 [Fusarium decemcellulare]|uniref:Uncharacterized protein n=1 Tax=Fusarium decemcellulare TaxID=57161 RepID=A0ACC1S8C0_9HYPO|nr:hypothetical protein NM208_g7624 [Fusarium decemcellulare]